MHSFYSNDKQTLEHQFDTFTCTQEEYNNESQALALVVPHAAYMYSGNVAYCGYKALHKALYNNTTPNALTFIMLGPCHSKNNKELNVVMKDEWYTPFGPCMLDRVLATPKKTGCYVTIISRLYDKTIHVRMNTVFKSNYQS